MTGFAVGIQVICTEYKTSDRMFEITWIPVIVAAGAICLGYTECFSSTMACVAAERLVISIE
jgi:hypothetical protein